MVSLAIFRSDKGDTQQNSFGAVVLHDNSQYKYKSKIQNKLVGEEYLFNDIKLTVADNTNPVFIRAHVYFDSTNEIAKDKIKFNSFSIKNHENYTWSRFGDYWYLCDSSGKLMSLSSTKAGEVYVLLNQTDAIVPEMQGVLGDDEFVSCEIIVQSSLASNFSNTTDFSEINKSFDKNATETTKTGTYSVVFKQNGETLSTQTINYGGKATIPEVTTAEGEVFLCWNTREDGSGANITNEQLGYITQNLTLYPIFENQKVLVTVIQSEGGTIAPETQMVDWGSDLVMHFTPNKNYVLKRILINGDPVGATSEYLLKRITGAVEVSAEFVSDYIVLDINGGAGEQPNVVYNGDQTKFMLEGNEPTKSGKEFYYYSTNSADNEQGQNGERYDLGFWYDIPNTSGTTTLFAIYLAPSSNYQTAANYIVVPKNISEISDSTVNMFGGTNNTVKFVTLPRTTTKIGKNTFANCSGLIGVSMSDFVTSIGENAFKSDSALTSFRAPTSLQTLGKAAFSGCTSLSKIKNLDATGITEIPSDCFSGCSKIEEIVLSANITKIGLGAFAGSGVKTINLEDTRLEELGASAFNSCSSLTQVTVPSTLKTVGQAAFMFSGITEVKNFAGTSVSKIESMAFYSSKLIQIEFPESLVSIENSAFASCSELTRVGGLQNTKVTLIASSAFSGCTKLKNAIFPQTLLTLGSDVFSGCSTLTNVTFNSSLTTIGANAFEGCSSLSQLTGLENTVVETIGDSAFKNCSSLVDASLPNTIQIIGGAAFANCSGLATINFVNDSNLSTLSVATDSFTGTTSDLKVNILDESHFDEYISKLNGKGFAENAFMFFLGNIDRKAYYKNAIWEKFRDAVITSTAGEHGTISPSGAVIYSLGSSASYVISPETGYKIKKILVDGVEIVVTAAEGAAQSYEFVNIQKDHTVSAEFEQRVFKITVNCGENGKINPSESADYEYGSNVSFVITPNDGYVIKDVLIDGVSNAKAKENAEYTFSNVRSDHEIEVSFEVVTFTIVSSVGEGGTMSPNQITTIKNWGESHEVTYTPNEKYVISTIIVDGEALNLSGVDVSKPYIYSFSKITANHVISCQFESTQRTLTYDPNGGAFADGDSSKTQEYNAFSNQTISLISSNPVRTGYNFKSWNTMPDGSGKGNSELTGAIYSSVFGKEDGWLYAIWEIKQFTITTSAGDHGTITESMTVDWGTTATVEMKPDEGYRVATYSVDGGNAITSTAKAGSSDYFTFRNITENHTISVTFAPITYIIKYNGNGATSGSTANSTHTYDEEKELTANGFSRTGYNFAGWATKDAIGATTATAVTNGTSMTGNVGSGSDSIGTYFTKDATTSTKQWWAGLACNRFNAQAGLTYIWTIEVYHEMGKTIQNRMDANVSSSSTSGNDAAYGDSAVITPQQIPSGVWTTLTIRVKIIDGVTGPYIHHSFCPTSYVDGTGFTTAAKIYYRNSRIVAMQANPPEYMNCEKVKNLSVTQGDVVELYAVWAANQYIVSFDANGGTVSPTSQAAVYDSAYGALPTPTRTGYTFGGWYTFPNGYTKLEYIQATGTQYIDTGFTPNQNTGVQARFSSSDYGNSQFFAFGGAGSGCTDRAFECYPWTNNGAQRMQISYGSNYVFTSALTNGNVYYLDWNKNTYTFKDETKNTTESGTLTSATFTSPKTMCLFAINRTNGLTKSPNGKIYMLKIYDNGTLVRDFVPAKRNSDNAIGLYDMVGRKFYANAGTGTFTAGATQTVSTKVDSNTKVTTPSDHTLYADWTANSYTIKFSATDASITEQLWNYAGSTGYTSSNAGSYAKYTHNNSRVAELKNVVFDSTLSVYTPIPICLGHTFAGWYSAASGGVKVANADGSLVANVSGFTGVNKQWQSAKETTLYARWTTNVYTITYTLNGGTKGSTSPSQYTFGTNTTISDPTRTGYTFTGWSVVATLDGKENGTINMSSGIMQYTSDYPSAVYFPLFYQNAGVQYTGKLGDKDVNGVPQIRWRQYSTAGAYSGNAGTAATNTINEAKFLSLWYHTGMSDSSSTTLSWTGGKSFKIDANQVGKLELVANWSANSYTVTANANGGTIPTTSGWTVASGSKTATKSVTYDSTYGALPTPTRTGYTFSGWYTFPKGYAQLEYIQSSGTQYIDTGLTMEKSTTMRMEIMAQLTNNDNWAGVNGYMQYQANLGAGSKGLFVVDYNGSTYIENVYFNDALKYTRDWSSSYSESNNKVAVIGMGNAGNAWWTDTSANKNAQIGKWYYIKVYKSSTLVRDFIPAKRTSDSVVGLYDVVEGKFYTNSGTGTFTAGSTQITSTAVTSSTTVKTAQNHSIYADWTANKYNVFFDLTNITKYNYSASKTTNGVTITSNSDGTYTLNGTMTDSLYGLVSIPINFKVGQQWQAFSTYVSGSYSAKSTSNHCFVLELNNSSGGTPSTRCKTDFSPSQSNAGQRVLHSSSESKLTTTEQANCTQLIFWIWINDANSAYVFNNYRFKLEVSMFPQQQVTYGSIYGTLPTPVKSGETFAGWYDAASGGNQITSSSKVATAYDHTLYSAWSGAVTISVASSSYYSNVKYSTSTGKSGSISNGGSVRLTGVPSGTIITISATVIAHGSVCSTDTKLMNRYYGFNLNGTFYRNMGTEQATISGTVTVSLDVNSINMTGKYQDVLPLCCVEGDSLVSMVDGTQKQIKDINVGDKVWSYNTTTQKLEETIVESLFKVNRAEIVHITFADGTILKITPDHPIFSERGWIAYSTESGRLSYPDVDLQEEGTQIGDMILSLSMLFDKEIVSMEYFEGQFETYTLKVQDNKNFFAQNVLIHNKPICPVIFCCVDGETDITMADGSTKKAKDISVGDEVLSYNHETKQYEKTTIEETITPYREKILEITFEDGSTLKITDDHPLLSERGWICYNPELGQLAYASYGVCDKAMQAGDKIITETGAKTIASIKVIEFEDLEIVYTFKLANGLAYIANGNIVASVIK